MGNRIVNLLELRGREEFHRQYYRDQGELMKDSEGSLGDRVAVLPIERWWKLTKPLNKTLPVKLKIVKPKSRFSAAEGSFCPEPAHERSTS